MAKNSSIKTCTVHSRHHWSPAIPLSRLALLTCLGCGLLPAFSATATAADFSLIPVLTVSEEYTDNVFDTNHNGKTDFITRVMPGLSLTYKTPLWDWDLAYYYDYRYYAKRSQTDDSTNNGRVKGLVKLIDEKLFLELSDTYQQVSLNVVNDSTKDSLTSNQTDQNVGTVSPYLELRPTEAALFKTGYRYINTWYSDSSGVNKQDHVGFLDVTYEALPKIYATAGYSYTRELAGAVNSSPTAGTGVGGVSQQGGLFPFTTNSDLTYQIIYVGPRYEYAENSFFYAKGGVLVVDYSSGLHDNDPFWDVRLTHAFATSTLNLFTLATYAEDPQGIATLQTTYGANWNKIFKRGTLTLAGSYDEFSTGTSLRLNTKRYSGGFTGTHEFTEKVLGSVGFTYEHFDDVISKVNTDKYTVDSSLSYNFATNTTLALNYRFIDYTSDVPTGDNRQINRVILEVKQLFGR